MEFALFYEIPVAQPWDDLSEYRAMHETVAEAIHGEKHGWDAFWTVEHHFLSEFSHCSNPEVLYGAIAAQTERIRLGYGVRLMPKPYNHPIRSAESAAMLDIISDGRVEFGTGRSLTKIEMEGFGVDPSQTRPMWREAIQHVVGAWTNEWHELDGEFWQMPRRRVHPKPLQKPHPPLWGATGSDDGHREMGRLGMGLLSFAVSSTPDEVKRRIDVYRDAIADCTDPIGSYVNNRAATFTMTLCAEDTDTAIDKARESFEWYPAFTSYSVGEMYAWLAERDKAEERASYPLPERYEGNATAAPARPEGAVAAAERGTPTIEDMVERHGALVGDPERCLEICKEYEEAGVDLLLCLVNPYNVSHEDVMKTIELIGTEVIPHFKDKR
jgi:alkanesulfonate monooxygenase SsuD/methylene tetrahydromethanopterin reductase-like flavin-dependent oxidoreductase (luciferase family)